MARSVNHWGELAETRQPQAPKPSNWLEALRQALARQRALDEEAARLQIRKRRRP